MKYIALLTFIAVVFIWLFNIQTLREVTELEKQLKTANETLEELDKALEQATKAAKFSIKHSFSDTMNRYNKK